MFLCNFSGLSFVLLPELLYQAAVLGAVSLVVSPWLAASPWPSHPKGLGGLSPIHHT